MKTRVLRIALGSLVCLALLAGFSTSGAQTRDSPVPPEDMSEAPKGQLAPTRPETLKPPSPGKGYVPLPLDLSHLTGEWVPSGRVQTQALPSSFDWRDTGKVTSVRDQSTCGACYAFAALGNIESKLLIDGAGTYDFSENHAKECNWFETDGSGTSCSGGNYYHVANLFSKKGTVLESCDPYVPSDVACKSTCPYQKTLLDWRLINGSGVPAPSVLKQYIYTYGPVFTAIYAGYYDAWDTEFSSYDGSYTLYHPGTESPNHAVLIVGWDDSLTHTGGSGGWIVKNSWGTGWGDSGYFKIAYGSASIGTSSSFVYDWQDYDAGGGLMYYDEGGGAYGWGYGDTTGYGLVRFTPASNAYATRVEFWTWDVTTDIDIYIYDSFDGNQPTNLLGQSLNHSFNEAGYHSVPLASPLPLTTGDDVVVVVKFTNQSYGYPVPMDMYGPAETGRTYESHDGIAGSWNEMSYDVAIRLRTTSATVPDVRITKRVVGSDFSPGDPIAFALDIGNSGAEVASNAVVSDTVPDEVLNLTYASTLAVTPVGGDPYVWNVEPLDIGESGVITIYGQIDPSLDSPFLFENTATISDPEDNTPANNTSTVLIGGQSVYLPMVARRSPPIPYTPVLNAISNPDGDGNYTVSWGTAELADTYTLEEDDNAAFSSPTTRYTGSGTSWGASDKLAGTYYYRVKANNSWGSSGWSNVRSVVVQTGWVNLLSEDFEGSFPGSTWTVRDNDSNSGRYYWGKRDCRPHTGSYSAWSAGAGDTTISCGSYYRNDMFAWMIYGPFSLSGATAAELTFDWWSDTELDYDAFFWGASTNGDDFYGTFASGNWSSWTTGQQMDLSAVPTLGNLLGKKRVWIAFVFGSDGSVTDRGSFVDNVEVRKRTGSSVSANQSPLSLQPVLQLDQTMEFGELRLGQPAVWNLSKEPR